MRSINIDKFQALDIEIELLKDCSNDKAFFQRIVTRTIPTIRKLFPDIVLNWEKELLIDKRVTVAIEELTNAFLDLWQTARIQRNYGLQRQLIVVLRKVRGPNFEFGGPLLKIIYPTIKNLYVSHCVFGKKYPFGLIAQSIMNFDDNWKKQYNSHSADWHFTYDHNCRKLVDWGSEKTPSKTILETRHWSLITGKSINFKKLFSVKTQLNSKLMLRKLSPYPKQHEIDEMQKGFAPSATSLYLEKHLQFVCDLNCFPFRLWQMLLFLQDSWAVKDNMILKEIWPRFRASKDEIGIIAYDRYNRFTLLLSANELRIKHNEQERIKIYKKEDYLCYILRCRSELHLLHLIPELQPSLHEDSKKNPPIPKVGSDEMLFCEWYADWLVRNGYKPPHQKTYDYTISDYRKSFPQSNYQDSTYKTWIRNYKKRRKCQKHPMA